MSCRLTLYLPMLINSAMKKTFFRKYQYALLGGSVLLFALFAMSPVFSHEYIFQHIVAQAQAENIDKRKTTASGLAVPRFVSIKAHKANMRRGPGKQYPVIWQFRKSGLPVEIIGEHGLWRHVRDYEGIQGWMHVSVLQGARYVIVRHKQAIALRHKARDKARILALLQPGVMAALKKCKTNWCEIKLNQQKSKYRGWVRRDALWGVYPFEFRD